MISKVLTIAGSDCSGGAGIQADLKTFTVHKCYGMSVITALTAQNTQAVQGVLGVCSDFIESQLDSVFSDIVPNATKIGMVSNVDAINSIANKLIQYNAKNIVLDPVMVSTSGYDLLDDNAYEALKEKLFPLASLITPNILEAQKLLNIKIENAQDMENAAMLLNKSFNVPFLIKGGHNVNDANDVLCYEQKIHWFNSKRILNDNTHGTGCTLSSAIACNLAMNKNLVDSIKMAKDFLTSILKSDMDLGEGSGPLNHTYIIK
ncbi:MAG: bifunctional hydroxymethylpyrimidine kinase/phosphomethylpyrimidine kinase [Mycoplasma sp.]